MIVDWVVQAPVLLVAVLVVYLPGVGAMLGLGARGLALYASAPLFSVAATALTAIAFGAIGIPWSPLSWCAAMIVLIGTVWGVGTVLGGRLSSPAPSAARWVMPAGIVLGSVIGMWRLVAYITDPAAISQTNDAVFHMNAVRFILETADASSLHVNAVIGGDSFYPAAWHGIASLIALITGTSIPIAANMLTLVIGAIIWPLGVAWLTRLSTGSDTAAATAAILSGALQTFPLLMFQWGVLFPNALSLALIPAGIGVLMSLPWWDDHREGWRSITHAVVIVLITAAALTLSQPSAILPWLAVTLVWFTARLILRGRGRAVMRWGVLAVLWLGLAAIWFLLARSTSGSHWPSFRGKLEVFLDVLLNGQMEIPFAIGVSILMLWGLVVAGRNRDLRWLVVAWLGVSALYVMVAAIGSPLVRSDILGAWYADPYRISALAPLIVIPLAGIGFHDLIERAVAVIDRRRGARTGVLPVLALVAPTVFMIVLVLIRPVAMPVFLEDRFDTESRYEATEDSYLTPDERAMLESLGDHIGEGERVLGNPSTASGFGYMLSGVDVYPRTWSSPPTEAWALLGTSLRDAADDPGVCEALHAYGDPQYVLDFGLGETTPGRYELPGMTDFDGQPGFERVTEIGDVSLWRITACKP